MRECPHQRAKQRDVEEADWADLVSLVKLKAEYFRIKDCY